MDARQRTRSCFREPMPRGDVTPRGSKQIVIVMTRDVYDRIWDDPTEVRRILEQQITDWPELLPRGIQDGFSMGSSQMRS